MQTVRGRTLRTLRRTGRMNMSAVEPVTANTVQRTAASLSQADEKRGSGMSPPGRVVHSQKCSQGPLAPPPPPPLLLPVEVMLRRDLFRFRVEYGATCDTVRAHATRARIHSPAAKRV